MKNGLLVAVAMSLSLGAFAQGTEETPTDPVTGSKWTLTVKRTDVEPIEYTVDMKETGATHGAFGVYATTVDLDVVGTNKPAKYWLTINYYEDGTLVSSTGLKSAYRLQAPATAETLTVSGYYNNKGIQAAYSNSAYGIGDANYAVLTLFSPGKTGEPITQYFNAAREKRNEFKPVAGYKTLGEQCNWGSSSSIFQFSQNKVAPGIYKATIDYATSTFQVEAATAIDVEIDGMRTFVSPADVAIPDGVEAYTLAYKDGELAATKVEGFDLVANTPVVLKAYVPGSYTFDIKGTPQYVTTVDGAQYINDVKMENNALVGVMQPHYLPEAGYTLSEELFALWTSEMETPRAVIDPFTAYVVLPEDITVKPETLAVVFPGNGTSGIEDIQINSDSEAPAYNVLGIPVDKSYKGIVIRNGKKFVQK